MSETYFWGSGRIWICQASQIPTATTKKAKIIKQALTFRDYAHLYKTENLDSFNLELQLKNTEFAIKNKLKNLFNKLGDLTFGITLILKN